MTTGQWYPEIMYEEDDCGLSSKIPFIMVPQDKKMPLMLFVFESRETGEYEPGSSGESLPIVDMDLHQYADMAILKAGLAEEIYNKVRHCLGLAPLRDAVSDGKKISDNIRKNIEERTTNT
jgi:hypothetical protein